MRKPPPHLLYRLKLKWSRFYLAPSHSHCLCSLHNWLNSSSRRSSISSSSNNNALSLASRTGADGRLTRLLLLLRYRADAEVDSAQTTTGKGGSGGHAGLCQTAMAARVTEEEFTDQKERESAGPKTDTMGEEEAAELAMFPAGSVHGMGALARRHRGGRPRGGGGA